MSNAIEIIKINQIATPEIENSTFHSTQNEIKFFLKRSKFQDSEETSSNRRPHEMLTFRMLSQEFRSSVIKYVFVRRLKENTL